MNTSLPLRCDEMPEMRAMRAIASWDLVSAQVCCSVLQCHVLLSLSFIEFQPGVAPLIIVGTIRRPKKGWKKLCRSWRTKASRIKCRLLRDLVNWTVHEFNNLDNSNHRMHAYMHKPPPASNNPVVHYPSFLSPRKIMAYHLQQKLFEICCTYSILIKFNRRRMCCDGAH